MHSFISHNFCNYFSINTYLQQLEVPLVLLVALFAFLTEFFPFELFAELLLELFAELFVELFIPLFIEFLLVAFLLEFSDDIL